MAIIFSLKFEEEVFMFISKKRMLQALALSVLVMSTPSFSEASILVPRDAQEIQLTKEMENKILGVRLDDLISAQGSTFPSLANINEKLKKEMGNFIPNSEIEAIHNLYLAEYPKMLDGIYFYKIQAFVLYKDKSLAFETLLVSAGRGEMTINLIDSINLLQTDFVLETSLVDRKLIVKDERNNIRMVFPIGVGAFDEGVINEGITSLLTPRFSNANIPKSSIISKREMPRYFKGKPFIRIHDGEKRTEIGFHIEINDYFNRGFDSHGCMRLRESDLQALHDLLMYGPRSATPVVVKYRIQDEMDHPIKVNNKYFKTVVNKGSKEDPFFILDRDNLIQVSYRDNVAPPIDLLVDDSRDNYYELLNYNTEAQLKEQNARRAKECTSKVEGIQKEKERKKEFEKCMDEGKRKGGVGDWIYRKWVHG